MTQSTAPEDPNLPLRDPSMPDVQILVARRKKRIPKWRRNLMAFSGLLTGWLRPKASSRRTLPTQSSATREEPPVAAHHYREVT